MPLDEELEEEFSFIPFPRRMPLKEEELEEELSFIRLPRRMPLEEEELGEELLLFPLPRRIAFPRPIGLPRRQPFPLSLLLFPPLKRPIPFPQPDLLPLPLELLLVELFESISKRRPPLELMELWEELFIPFPTFPFEELPHRSVGEGEM